MQAQCPDIIRRRIAAYRPPVSQLRSLRVARREWWLDRLQNQCEMFAYDCLKLAALGTVLALLFGHGA